MAHNKASFSHGGYPLESVVDPRWRTYTVKTEIQPGRLRRTKHPALSLCLSLSLSLTHTHTLSVSVSLSLSEIMSLSDRLSLSLSELNETTLLLLVWLSGQQTFQQQFLTVSFFFSLSLSVSVCVCVSFPNLTWDSILCPPLMAAMLPVPVSSQL